MTTQKKEVSRLGSSSPWISTQGKEEGQSTIEFLTTFTFVVGFVFLFVKFSVNITNGFLVHYGTYMASRAYMSFEDNGQESTATDGAAASLGAKVFNDLDISKFLGGSRVNISFNSPDATGKPIYVGVVAKFSQSFGAFKAVGGGEPLSLTSESFLGREPIRSECVARICKAMADSQLGGSCTSEFLTLFDNGC